MVVAWNWKNLDAVVTFLKVRAKPMVLVVPVFVPYSESWRVGSCYIEACLVVFEDVADVRDVIAWDVESSHYFLEDVTERDESTNADGEGRMPAPCDIKPCRLLAHDSINIRLLIDPLPARCLHMMLTRIQQTRAVTVDLPGRQWIFYLFGLKPR